MEKYLVAQIGARMNYAVPRILNDDGKLLKLATDMCSVKGYGALMPRMTRVLNNKYLKKMAQRIPGDIPIENIKTYDYFGIAYFLKLRKAKNQAEVRKAQLWAKTHFPQLILESSNIEANVFSFNCAGLEIMQEAKKAGFRAVMEQTIAPMELELRLTQEQQRKFPAWDSVLAESDEYTQELIKREKEEWDIADKIICGSVFVNDGIRLCGGPYTKCEVVPYGISYQDNLPKSNNTRTSGKINILTVGTLELRKGTPYILELAKRFKNKANFKIVGLYDHLPPSIINELKTHIDLVGTVPRKQVRDFYEWADVFLFPSICEGSATVIYEAMSHGLPIITTKNSGSIIRDGEEGYIVETEESTELEKKFESLISSEKLISRYGQASLQRFNSFGHYNHYKERLLKALEI